jgi:hypothetical protein
MTDLLLLALAALAAFRVGVMVAYEVGPFGLARALREWALVRFGGDSVAYIGLTCPYCISFWLALPAAALAVGAGSLPWLALPLAWGGVAGAAGLIIDVAQGGD